MSIYLLLLSTPNSFPLRIWCRRFFISKGLRFIKLSEASSPKNNCLVSVLDTGLLAGEGGVRRALGVVTKNGVAGLPASGLKYIDH